MTTLRARLKVLGAWAAQRFSEKTTAQGLISAVVLLAGWRLAPSTLEALAVLTSLANAAYLIIIKEPD